MAFPLHHGSKFNSFLVLLSFSLELTFLACGGGDEQPTEPDEPVPEVTAVEVNPDSTRLTALGAEKDFDATARDQNGNQMSGVSFSWSVAPDSIGTVDGEGTVTAEANGSATVEASAQGVTGSADLIVDQSVSRVTISPDSATLTSVGDSLNFKATAADRNGHEVEDVSIHWSSSDSSVATVNDTGLATAQGEGDATVAAEANEVEGTASLNVRISSGRLVRSFATHTDVAIKSSIAVGRTRIVLSSGRYLLYSKDGARLAAVPVSEVYSEFEDAAGADARAIYDPNSDRFYLTSMDHGEGGRHSTDTPGRYFLAVSTSSAPSGFGPEEWHTYAFKTRSDANEPALFPDIPRLSVTENAVVLVGQVTAVDPDERPEFGCFTQLVIVDKSTVLSGSDADPAFMDEIRNGERSCVWLQPAKTAPSSALPMVTETRDCRLEVWTLRSLLTDPSIEHTEVPGSGKSEPYFCTDIPHAPQPDTDWRLRTGRRSQPMWQPAYRYGSLWTSTTIGVHTDGGDVTGIRWAEIGGVAESGTPQLLQSGTFHTEHHAFYSAIAPNENGDFVVAYGRSSETLYPGAYYRYADAGYPSDSISGPRVLKEGEASLTSGQVLDDAIRFAEFFDVSPDPTDDGLWMVGQYAKTSDTYDLWAGKVAF